MTATGPSQEPGASTPGAPGTASTNAAGASLVPYKPISAPVTKAYRRPWWDPRRWAGAAMRRWNRSMQLRTVTITVMLCAVAEIITGALLSARIADGLFQERMQQVTAEASRGLMQADSAFSSAATSNSRSASSLVLDTVRAMKGDGVSVRRDVVLRVLPGQSPYWVSGQDTNAVAAESITPGLQQAVQDGNDIYWQSVALKTPDGVAPGVAFGKRVVIPPGRDYAMYLVYDFAQVQSTLDLIHGVLLVGGAALLVVIGGIAWYAARRSLQPVASAAATAEKLARGHLDERMPVGGTDEVASLGRSFNRMADSLAEQIVQLEALSHMQQRFVSDVSHELRTPLTTVRMAAEVLHDARDSFDPMNRRSAELLYDQVERFQGLLNDLLEISRFDAGAAVLDAGYWDLIPVVRRAVETARPHAENAGSELVLTAPAEPLTVQMDPRRIERIVRNLVLNAVEHGEGRPVEVAVAGDANAVAVSVRDHGIGLAPLDVARVFDRFWRKDPARTRTTGGSGLGLSIAMQDARLHGGWLQAWGELGDGAAFRLTLPRRLGQLLTSSPLPLGEPERPGGTEAGFIEEEGEWLSRTGEVFQDAQERDDAAADGPVPGTVPRYVTPRDDAAAVGRDDEAAGRDGRQDEDHRGGEGA